MASRLQVAVRKEHAATVGRQAVVTLVPVLFEDLFGCDLNFLLLYHVTIIANKADHCVLVRPFFHDCLVPVEKLLDLKHARHVIQHHERLLVPEVLRKLALQVVKCILLYRNNAFIKGLTYDSALDLGFSVET